MNFQAFSIQPAAGAAGIVSCAQLLAAGRPAPAHPALQSGKALPQASAVAARQRQREGLARHRAQYNTQCRAACMSKFS